MQASAAKLNLAMSPRRGPSSKQGVQPRSPVQRAPETVPRPRVPISPFQLDAQRENGDLFAANGIVGIRRAATAPQQSLVNPFAGQLVRYCRWLPVIASRAVARGWRHCRPAWHGRYGDRLHSCLTLAVNRNLLCWRQPLASNREACQCLSTAHRASPHLSADAWCPRALQGTWTPDDDGNAESSIADWQAVGPRSADTADSSTSSRSVASLMADNSFAEWLALERSSSRLGAGIAVGAGGPSHHGSRPGSPPGAYSPRLGSRRRHPDTVPGAMFCPAKHVLRCGKVS